MKMKSLLKARINEVDMVRRLFPKLSEGTMWSPGNINTKPDTAMKQTFTSDKGYKLTEYISKPGVWVLSNPKGDFISDSAKYQKLDAHRAQLWANMILDVVKGLEPAGV